MFKLILVLAMAAVVSAGLVPGEERGTWVEGEEVTSVNQLPSIPVPGRGADALFIFAAYANVAGLAWGSEYWNPTDNQFPSTWSYDAVNPSTAEPMDTPYHWNGGLGTALDNLGYTWEWYPTWDDADGMQTCLTGTELQDYDIVFVHTFDNWQNEGLNSGTRDKLDDYMAAGGIVVFVGQDAHWGGIPDAWLQDNFACGTITDDVISGDSLVTASGIAGTFADGWSGTADKANFADGNGFYTDQLELNGFVGDGGAFYGSFKDATKCIFSAFEFEACSPSEVEAMADAIMTYAGISGALEQSTWGSIKNSF